MGAYKGRTELVAQPATGLGSIWPFREAGFLLREARRRKGGERDSEKNAFGVGGSIGYGCDAFGVCYARAGSPYCGVFRK